MCTAKPPKTRPSSSTSKTPCSSSSSTTTTFLTPLWWTLLVTLNLLWLVFLSRQAFSLLQTLWQAPTDDYLFFFRLAAAMVRMWVVEPLSVWVGEYVDLLM